MSLINRSAKTILGTCAVCIVSWPAYLSAQNSSPKLEEVIVVAQKREESLQDTPISISAFSSDQLEAMHVQNIEGITQYTPNLLILPIPGSQNNNFFSIRGVSTRDQIVLYEMTVGIYLDGIYLARNTGVGFDLLDVQQIEVLRGPQGTLYGRNTIGGAINIITEPPREEFGFKQKISAGNFGYKRSNSTLDTGLLADQFSAKLTYNYSEGDGDIKNIVNGTDLGEYDDQAGRIALRWLPSDSVTIDYTNDFYESDSNGSTSQMTDVRPPYAQIGGAISKQAAASVSHERRSEMSLYRTDGKTSNVENNMNALHVAWDISDDLTFKSISAYREFDNDEKPSPDFGSFLTDGETVLNDPTVAPGQVLPAGIPLGPFMPGYTKRHQDQTSQEFQFIGNALDSRLKYVAGLYYFKEEGKEDAPSQVVMPAGIAFGKQPPPIKSFLCGDPTFSDPLACFGKDVLLSTPINIYGGETESYATYAQGTYNFIQDWNITLGVRYSYDDKSGYIQNSGIENGEVKLTNSDNWDNWSGAVTVDYDWTNDVNVYGTVSSGYRSGGFNFRAASADAFESPYNAETMYNYELGLKSIWWDQRVRFNGAVFFMKYDDTQVNSFRAGAGGATSVIDNAGSAETQGLELDITALLTENITFNMGYGYVDSDFKEYITQRLDPITSFPDLGPNADPITGTEDISGIAKVPMAPKHNGFAGLTYNFDAFDWAEVSARIDMTYVSKYDFAEQLNYYTTTKDQTLWNTSINVASIEALGGSLDVQFWGRNLTNEKYAVSAVDFGTLGFATSTYLNGLTYGIDLVYKFGRD